MRKLFFGFFIAFITFFICTLSFANGLYDGVWLGTGTIIVGSYSDKSTTGTIIYQADNNTIYYYLGESTPIKLIRSGSNWKLVSPLRKNIDGNAFYISEFIITFQSSNYYTSTMKFTIDEVSATFTEKLYKTNCKNLDINSTVSNLSGAINSISCFQINVDEETKKINVKTWGGNGDCDIEVVYFRPVNNHWDSQISENFDNNESISIESPDEGRWYIVLFGSDYDAYSGLKLKYFLKNAPVEALQLLLLY